MDLKRNIKAGLMTVAAMLLFPAEVLATPHFTLNPAATTITAGQSFSVIMGVDSDTEKVIGIDVVASFDATRLSVESIEKGTVPADGYNFGYTPDKAIIHNDTGKFELTLPSADSSVYNGVVAKHELLKINFKAKDVLGTATLNFTCQGGLLTESNIINDKAADVIDCASNQSGSYTIVAASGGAVDPTPTTAPGVTTVPTPTTAPSELPRTGFGQTMALVVVGAVSMIAALFLRLI